MFFVCFASVIYLKGTKLKYETIYCLFSIYFVTKIILKDDSRSIDIFDLFYVCFYLKHKMVEYVAVFRLFFTYFVTKINLEDNTKFTDVFCLFCVCYLSEGCKVEIRDYLLSVFH